MRSGNTTHTKFLNKIYSVNVEEFLNCTYVLVIYRWNEVTEKRGTEYTHLAFYYFTI